TRHWLRAGRSPRQWRRRSPWRWNRQETLLRPGKWPDHRWANASFEGSIHSTTDHSGSVTMDKPVTPRGVNHLVLNVRDIEESQRLWTEIVGFHQVGQLTPTAERPNPPKMRFY